MTYYCKNSDQMLIDLKMISMGIVPIKLSSRNVLEDVKKYLSALSPEERRIITRKFRKVWRKSAKRRAQDARGKTQQNFIRLQNYHLIDMMPDNHRPTSHATRERIQMVTSEIYRQVMSEK